MNGRPFSNRQIDAGMKFIAPLVKGIPAFPKTIGDVTRYASRKQRFVVVRAVGILGRLGRPVRAVPIKIGVVFRIGADGQRARTCEETAERQDSSLSCANRAPNGLELSRGEDKADQH